MRRILETSALTEAQLENARTLAENCNLYESLDYLHPTTDMASHGNHFHFYDNEKLIGFLTFPFNGIRDPEAYLIVDPPHRRKGIGRTLLDAAKESCKRRGIQQFLLVWRLRQGKSTLRRMLRNLEGVRRLVRGSQHTRPTIQDRILEEQLR